MIQCGRWIITWRRWIVPWRTCTMRWWSWMLTSQRWFLRIRVTGSASLFRKVVIKWVLLLKLKIESTYNLQTQKIKYLPQLSLNSSWTLLIVDFWDKNSFFMPNALNMKLTSVNFVKIRLAGIIYCISTCLIEKFNKFFEPLGFAKDF